MDHDPPGAELADVARRPIDRRVAVVGLERQRRRPLQTDAPPLLAGDDVVHVAAGHGASRQVSRSYARPYHPVPPAPTAGPRHETSRFVRRPHPGPAPRAGGRRRLGDAPGQPAGPRRRPRPRRAGGARHRRARRGRRPHHPRRLPGRRGASTGLPPRPGAVFPDGPAAAGRLGRALGPAGRSHLADRLDAPPAPAARPRSGRRRGAPGRPAGRARRLRRGRRRRARRARRPAVRVPRRPPGARAVAGRGLHPGRVRDVPRPPVRRRARDRARPRGRRGGPARPARGLPDARGRRLGRAHRGAGVRAAAGPDGRPARRLPARRPDPGRARPGQPGLEQLGRRRRPVRDRQRHRRRRHAPGLAAPPHLVPRLAGAARRRRRAPRDRRHLARRPARRRREQRRRGVGLHQLLRRLHRLRPARARPGPAGLGPDGLRERRRRHAARAGGRGRRRPRAGGPADALGTGHAPRRRRDGLRDAVGRPPDGLDRPRAAQRGDGDDAGRGARRRQPVGHPGPELRGRRPRRADRVDHRRPAPLPCRARRQASGRLDGPERPLGPLPPPRRDPARRRPCRRAAVDGERACGLGRGAGRARRRRLRARRPSAADPRRPSRAHRADLGARPARHPARRPRPVLRALARPPARHDSTGRTSRPPAPSSASSPTTGAAAPPPTTPATGWSASSAPRWSTA